jgi:PAS domain S-box-containing protein
MAEKDTPTHPWLMERRYFSMLIVLVFVILSAMTFFICYRQHTINTEQTLKEDGSAANLLSLVLDEHLKRLVSIMESYSNQQPLLQAVRDKNAEKAVVHLINLKKSNPDVDILILTDRQGTFWGSYPERPESMGMNLAHRDWYKGVSKEWKPNISDVVQRIVREKDLAIQISVPFINENGDVIGILVNTQRTAGLSYLFKQAHLDPGTTITATDRKGQIVYSSRHDVEAGLKPYPFHSGMKKAMAEKNKTFTVDDPDLGGNARYISFAPVANIGWTVFVERDQRSILLSEMAYYIQMTVIALLLFLSTIFFLAYLRKLVTAQQIQGQLEAEKKLRAGEERYESYINVTMQLAWTTNCQGEIVEENPSWSKYTGRDYEEIKSFGWIEDIHPDDRDRTGQIWSKAVAEKSFYETEYRVRRYDGVYRDYLARGIPLLAEDGSVREWVGTCIDITDRKQAEEEIRKLNAELEQRVIDRTARLNATNKELESFAHSVSHDLRAPLRGIDGWSLALLEDYGERLDDQARQYLKLVRAETQQMGRLIDDLLKLSRITRAEMQLAPIDLTAMASRIAGRLQEERPDHRIEFIIQPGLRADGDGQLLEIALSNLLDNAIKFTGKQTQARIEFGEAEADEGKAFFVRDNGVGFDMSYAPKLFGAFQRLHKTSEFPGTGIGLATVQRIIHRHGGRIWAEAKTDRGATFYFTLKEVI